MKVKFIVNVNIRDQIHIKTGETFTAFLDKEGEYFHIMMEDGSAVIAPVWQTHGIFEVIDD